MAGENKKLTELDLVTSPVDLALFYLVQDSGTVATSFAITFQDLSTAVHDSNNAITDLTGDVTASGPGSVPATLSNTGVAAATYGDATHVSQIAVDVKGRITSASNVVITAGTVSSVALTMPTGFSVAGSPVTSSGTLAVTTALSGVIKVSTGAFANAVAGTDYVAPGAVTTSGLTQATGKLLGRSTASTGAIEEITVGSGLTLSGGSLSASGGSGMSIGGTVTSGTAGSVLFVATGPVLAQDNSNFFWDDSNDRLGIGTATPAASKIHVKGTADSNAFIRIDDSGSSVQTYVGANNLSAEGFVGTLSNHNFTLRANNTDWVTIGTTGGFGIGAIIANTNLSISKSLATASGVIADIRNTSTATHSFAQVELDGNNASTIATFTCDGLGSGTVLGAAGAYVGTFSNHIFALVTNSVKRLTVDTSGNVAIASLTASRPVFTDGSKNLISGSAGANFGPSAVASITVVNGIVTAIS